MSSDRAAERVALPDWVLDMLRPLSSVEALPRRDLYSFDLVTELSFSPERLKDLAREVPQFLQVRELFGGSLSFPERSTRSEWEAVMTFRVPAAAPEVTPWTYQRRLAIWGDEQVVSIEVLYDDPVW